jgi:phosphoribosylglycinamide formyltransferase-1
MQKRIAVFISGRGSNFRSIYAEIVKKSIDGVIAAVISDNEDAKGLVFARENGLDFRVFPWKGSVSRTDYFNDIIDYLSDKDIDLIILAGFMIVLSQTFIHRYKNRIINIHPALLPSFPGVEAQRQALDYGVKFTGCTVHFVDEGVDTGPIIKQRVVPLLDGDDVESLSARILEQEHELFPEVVRLFCENRLVIEGRRVYITDPDE